MTNRTVQIYGYGFGSTDAEINVTLDGNVIFNGTVTTTNQPVPPLPNNELTTDTVPIFSYDIPVTYAGTNVMSCQVTKGTVIFAQIAANYSNVKNSIYTDSDWAIINDPSSSKQQVYDVVVNYANPPFSQEETDILLNPQTSLSQVFNILQLHSCPIFVSSGQTGFEFQPADTRSNITIDGVARTPDYQQYPGIWWWVVSAGSTLQHNLNITAGRE